ncbi:S41 family peptidase [Bacillus sp. FJAT-44742]|uniref:S41 family peptidase n=1 Tax=Bacillus sp. FJAT-44742 TaxID=2014005 RepID=UPI000C238141|nr:S41 family peptidase [Bacillus sp. FJAT-44742]
MDISSKAMGLIAAVAIVAGGGGLYAGSNFLGDNEDRGQEPADEAATEASVNLAEELNPGGQTSDGDFEKVHHAFEIISQQYVEEVDEDLLIEGAIEGMVEKLEDPHSVYMDQETATQFTESLDSHFEGIGAEVSMTDGYVTIVAPFRDSPAEEAGLQPNDQVVEIDGESTEGLSLYEAVLEIRGEKGTVVNLTISRPGNSDSFTVEVERDEIPVETVRSDTYEHKGQTVGVLEITSFSENTSQEFTEHLKNLESEDIDGLIVDVRGNPGGYLNSVEEIGDQIIPQGESIVQIESREGEVASYVSSLEEEKDYPVVGVIDRGSVSASEILAGALKEAGDYDLVGETTYGKGTVQQPIQLGDGSELKLSLFKWLTSDGNDINEVGVEPTVEVQQPEYFYLAALAVDDEEPLERDSMGDQIRAAQEMLTGLGYETGRTDGYFDAQTERAVQAFQNSSDIEATGIIDEETANAMHQELVELVRDPDNDEQLKTAIELVVEQSSAE